MTDKKLTDNEIIKALEGAILNAKKCDSKVWSIEVYKLEKALDLISCLQAKAIKEQNKNSKLRNERNRLQAQNKDLAETVHNLTIEKDALFDKVEELKAEIERLNALVKTKNKLIEGLDQSISYAYDRAIKEFAERLKEKAYTHSDITGYQSTVVDVCEIDGVYEELVGEDNG